MNQVGSDTVKWHLEQAALHELIATHDDRHGFHDAADKARGRAKAHRDKAAELNPKKVT